MSNKIEQLNMETNHENHNDHQELFNSAWAKSSDNLLVKGLNQGLKIEDVLQNMPGFREAFSHISLLDRPGCVLKCSDGRVKPGGRNPAIALAGEGLLTEGDDSIILRQAITDKHLLITGHEGCGAADIAHPGPDSDQYGYQKAQSLSAETHNDYKEVHRDEFRSTVHDERALVVDGTLRFDCTNWTEFPPQFLSSAAGLGLSDEYIKIEAKALSGIALSDHGFNERFSSDSPFHIIISAQSHEQLNHLLNITKSAVEEFGDRVRVDGFVAPVSPENQK